ncbi:MAG: hypothetical protein U0790_09235 [Isosphaeraceae bacterium]
MRTSRSVAGDLREGAGRLELDRRAEGVADGQPQHRAAAAVRD